MVDDTQREAVDIIVVGPAHNVGSEELVRLIEWAVIQVDNAQVLSHGVRELGLFLQFPLKGIMRSVFDSAGRDSRLIHVLKVVRKGLGVVDVTSEVCRIASGEDGTSICGPDGNIPSSQMVVDEASKEEDEDDTSGTDDGESRIS